MQYEYQPTGVCAKAFTITIEDGTLKNCHITGGCDGNLKGVIALAKNRPITELVELLEGIRCGNKSTSCPDQLAKALKAAAGC